MIFISLIYNGFRGKDKNRDRRLNIQVIIAVLILHVSHTCYFKTFIMYFIYRSTVFYIDSPEHFILHVPQLNSQREKQLEQYYILNKY